MGGRGVTLRSALQTVGPFMLIGILQTGLAPDALAPEMGDYPDMFARLLDGNGFSFRTYRVVEGRFPDARRDGM